MLIKFKKLHGLRQSMPCWLKKKYYWQLYTISAQKFNDHIHEICKIAGFNEIVVRERFYGNKRDVEDIPRYKLISSHTARRTFITLSEQRGVNYSLIMKVTGIKSLFSSLCYKQHNISFSTYIFYIITIN